MAPLAELFARLMLRMDAACVHREKEISFAGEQVFANTVRAFVRDLDGGGMFTDRLAAAAHSLEHILPRLRLVHGDELGLASRAR
ncbi:MAG: hypothetical protein ABI889_09870 [Gemmatimonadota bacterium]